MKAPLCECHECHGEEMWWQPDKRRKPGGYWRCKAKRREAWRKHNQTDKARQRMSDRHYSQPGVWHNTRTLRERRRKALQRMVKRNSRRRTETNG